MFLAGMFLIHAVIFWSLRDRLRAGYPDFTIFYAAGKMVRQGMASRLYDRALQFRIQQEFAPRVEIRQGALPYNHPPFEALLFAPFTWLPYFAAYLLWDLVNVLILAALPFLLRPHLPLAGRARGAFWILLSLAFFPVFIVLLQGQDSILLLLLLTLSFVALKKNAAFLAGCWLGLGLFRFHLVLPLLLILLLHKKWRTIFGCTLVAGALGLLSLAVVGWKQAMAYPAWVWNAEKAMGQETALVSAMPNLRGLVESVGLAQVSKVGANLAIAILAMALLLFASVKWKAAGSGAVFDLGFSLAVVTTVLVSYHVLPHDLCLLLLPVLLVANRFPELTPSWKRLAVLGPMVVLFFTPADMLLWFRYGQFGLMAPVLLLWWWGITREISAQELRPGGSSAALESA
ncbi:MAG: DUF2029 domain-containing protein [Acidobacteriia bacterium]|nr:DUF2029 domain-containing protein [Terriglobia bacterium]